MERNTYAAEGGILQYESPNEQLKKTLRQMSSAALANLAISLCQKAVINAQQELQIAVSCCTGSCNPAGPDEALLRAEAAMHVAMRRTCLAKRLVSMLTRKCSNQLQHWPQHDREEDDGEEVCSSYTPVADC